MMKCDFNQCDKHQKDAPFCKRLSCTATDTELLMFSGKWKYYPVPKSIDYEEGVATYEIS